MMCNNSRQCPTQAVTIGSGKEPQYDKTENHGGRGETQPGSEEPARKKPFCRTTLCRGPATVLFLLYGALLLALMVKAYGHASPTSTTSDEPSDAPAEPDCCTIMRPLPRDEVLTTLFAARWILQEGYSNDGIDQFALTHSKSSWAEFSRGPNNTIILHMAHRLVRHRTVWCVYHYFPHMSFEADNATLHLTVPEFNATATIQFLRACNECLVISATANVPHYAPLDYLLAYGLYPETHEYFIIPTRDQASCKKLYPPGAPFKYSGADFCPREEECHDPKAKAPPVDWSRIFFPKWL